MAPLRSSLWSLAPALLLGLMLIAVYARSLDGGFLWDDDLHITANPVIVGPLGLKEIWTTARANYFPLVLTNFKLQHALWGLDPLGYRIVTLLFHAVAAVLLWRVLLRLAVPGAWLGAALWALHPVQVESVAWICELKNTQSAVFFLAAIVCWLRWIEAQPVSAPATSAATRGVRPTPARPDSGQRFYLLALGFAVLALLSKPSTVMLPVALSLCVWWRRGRLERRPLLATLPFFALSAIVALWTIWEQKHHSGALGAEWAHTFVERIGIAARALWFYLGKLAWPAALTFIYPRWSPGIGFAALLALGGILGVAAAAWRWRVRRWSRGAIFAGGYFVALLFPVLGFFDVYFFRYSFVGDHFQYLASIGPLALLAAGVSLAAPRALPWVGAALVGVFVVMTGEQATAYRSSLSLWSATTERNPDSAMAWAQLGAVHARDTRGGDAIACFQRALRLNPLHPEALNHLGCEYLRTGRLEEGVRELRRAIAARPDFAEAHCNLGIALLERRQNAEALSHLETALRLRPDATAPRYSLAQALHALGRAPEAIAHYEAALRAEPGRAQIHDDLGLALAAVGRGGEALAAYQRAIELAPALASPRNNLGALLAQSGRIADALGEFDAAVRLEPDYFDAHVNRGGALAALHRLPEAREAFARAVQLQPDSARAHAYLGQILQALGREAEARPHLQRASELETRAAR